MVMITAIIINITSILFFVLMEIIYLNTTVKWYLIATRIGNYVQFFYV